MRTHFEDSVAQYVTASVNLSGLVDLSVRILFQSTLWGLLMANFCMICGEFCCCSPLTSSKTETRKQEDRENIVRERPLANIMSNFLTYLHPVQGRNLFQKYSHLEYFWNSWCSSSRHTWFSIFNSDACVSETTEMTQGSYCWTTLSLFGLSGLITMYYRRGVCHFVKKQSAPSRLLVM